MKDLDFLGHKISKFPPSRGISGDFCVPQSSTYTSFYNTGLSLNVPVKGGGGVGDFARHGFLPSLSTTEQLWRARYSVIIRIICNINIDKKVLNDLMMNVICGVVEYFVGLSDDVKIKQMTIIIDGHIFPR